MKRFLLIIAILISATLFAQKKDSTLHYRSLYLANEAKYILKNGNSVKAVQLLLESLPEDLNTKKGPLHKESVDLLIDIYYNKDDSSIKINLDGDSYDFEFSPDGKYLVFTTINDQTIDIYVYDTSTAKLTKLPITPSRNNKIFAFSPCSRKIVVGEGDMITEWDIERCKILSELKYFTGVKKLAYAPDNEMVYVLGDENRIVLASFDDKPSRRINFGVEPITDFTLSGNRKVMLLKSSSKKSLWNMETLSPIGCDLSDIHYLEISPCGTRGIVAGKNHKAFSVIDLMSGEEMFKITTPVISRPVYTNNGKYIVGTSARYFNEHIIFNADNGNEVKLCSTSISYNDIIASNQDGSMLAKRLPNSLMIFKGVDNNYLIRQKKNTLDFDISKDDSMIATCSHDSTAMIWDLHTGKLKAGPLKHPLRSVRKIKFSPHGKSVATLCDKDSIVRLWNTDTGELLPQIIKDNKFINDMEISSCGKYIYTASNNGFIYKWHVATGAVADSTKLWNNSIAQIVFDWDNNVAATVSKDNIIAVWDMAKWEKLSGGKDSGMKHKNHVYYVNFSEDGSKVVSTSADSTMVVWNVATGDVIFKPEKFKSKAYDAKFLCNDSILAVSCWDSRVYLYNTENWEELPMKLQMDRRADNIQAVSNGEYLFVNSVFQPLAKFKRMKVSDIYAHYKSNALYRKPFSHTDSIQFHLNAIDSLGYAQAGKLYKDAYNTRKAEELFKRRKYDQAYAFVVKALDYQPARELYFDIYYKSEAIAYKDDKSYRSAMSKCGNYLINIRKDSTVVVLDSTGSKEIYKIKFNTDGKNIRISEDGKQFALYGQNIIDFYNIEDGSVQSGQIMTKNSIYDLLFTSGGKVVTIEDKYIYIRDIQTKKETEIALKNYCVSCSLSKDGKYLLYSDAMHNSYLWELGEENKLLATNGATGVPYNICSISENGKYYANTFGKCKIDWGRMSSDIMEIWNTKELKYAMEPVVMENNIVAMEFSPCGNYICTVEVDKNNDGNQKVSYYKIGDPKPLFESVVKSNLNGFSKIRFSKDGNYIALHGWNIVILDTTGKEAYHRVNNNHYISNLEFTDNNKCLMISTTNGTVILNLIKDSDLQQIIQKDAVNK